MAAANLIARVRSLVASLVESGDRPTETNPRGEQLVVVGMPDGAEVARMGQTWQVQSAAGLAALAALPTTTAGLSLYNAERDPRMQYVIESFGSLEEVADATQQDETVILAMNNAVASINTAPADAALVIRSVSGRKVDVLARTVVAGTVVNDGWFAHGPQAPFPSGAGGLIWKLNECYVPPGRTPYMVQPGGQFNIVAVKAAAQAALQHFYFIKFTRVLVPALL